MVDRKSSGLDDAICKRSGNETEISLSRRQISTNNFTDLDDEPERKKFTWTNKQQGLMLGIVIQNFVFSIDSDNQLRFPTDCQTM